MISIIEKQSWFDDAGNQLMASFDIKDETITLTGTGKVVFELDEALEVFHELTSMAKRAEENIESIKQ